jgi:membrane-bound serine protease (ClpP class)
MRPVLCTVLLCGVLAGGSAPAADPAPVYVIPIRDMIERGLVYVVRRGVTEAEKAGASAIVFDMDTPGGRLDATETIIQLITDISPRTVTFVNPNAISAGAIIAMATDAIYMSPIARIGDAMPIMMSPLPFGGPQDMPDGLKEKAISPTVALIRSAAQRKGHDPLLAEAMVRPEIEYAIGDTVICPAGQLLTLTSADAARTVGDPPRPLLSSGTVASLSELLETLGLAGAPVETIAVTGAERVARVIEGFPVSGILLALGLLGLYIEFKTPGFGLPGIAGILLLAVWFWGHNVAGLAGSGELLLFALGAVLLLIEIVLIPGFGITGLTGLTLMFAAILMAMVQHLPGQPWTLPPLPQIQHSVQNLGLALLTVFICGLVLARVLPKTTLFNRLALAARESRDTGYTAGAPVATRMGHAGTALTDLRPAGIGRIDGERLNVVAQGTYIEKGAPIVVTEEHGNRIVVTEGSSA